MPIIEIYVQITELVNVRLDRAVSRRRRASFWPILDSEASHGDDGERTLLLGTGGEVPLLIKVPIDAKVERRPPSYAVMRWHRNPLGCPSPGNWVRNRRKELVLRDACPGSACAEKHSEILSADVVFRIAMKSLRARNGDTFTLLAASDEQKRRAHLQDLSVGGRPGGMGGLLHEDDPDEMGTDRFVLVPGLRPEQPRGGAGQDPLRAEKNQQGEPTGSMPSGGVGLRRTAHGAVAKAREGNGEQAHIRDLSVQLGPDVCRPDLRDDSEPFRLAVEAVPLADGPARPAVGEGPGTAGSEVQADAIGAGEPGRPDDRDLVGLKPLRLAFPELGLEVIAPAGSKLRGGDEAPTLHIPGELPIARMCLPAFARVGRCGLKAEQFLAQPAEVLAQPQPPPARYDAERIPTGRKKSRATAAVGGPSLF